MVKQTDLSTLSKKQLVKLHNKGIINIINNNISIPKTKTSHRRPSQPRQLPSSYASSNNLGAGFTNASSILGDSIRENNRSLMIDNNNKVNPQLRIGNGEDNYRLDRSNATIEDVSDEYYKPLLGYDDGDDSFEPQINDPHPPHLQREKSMSSYNEVSVPDYEDDDNDQFQANYDNTDDFDIDEGSDLYRAYEPPEPVQQQSNPITPERINPMYISQTAHKLVSKSNPLAVKRNSMSSVNTKEITTPPKTPEPKKVEPELKLYVEDPALHKKHHDRQVLRQQLEELGIDHNARGISNNQAKMKEVLRHYKNDTNPVVVSYHLKPKKK